MPEGPSSRFTCFLQSSGAPSSWRAPAACHAFATSKRAKSKPVSACAPRASQSVKRTRRVVLVHRLVCSTSEPQTLSSCIAWQCSTRHHCTHTYQASLTRLSLICLQFGRRDTAVTNCNCSISGLAHTSLTHMCTIWTSCKCTGLRRGHASKAVRGAQATCKQAC